MEKHPGWNWGLYRIIMVIYYTILPDTKVSVMTNGIR